MVNETEVSGGLGFEVTGKGLDFEIGTLSTAVQRLAEQQSALSRLLTAKGTSAYTLRGRGFLNTGDDSPNAAGTAILDMGGPENGYQWSVRRLGVIAAASAITAVPGRADFYVTTTLNMGAAAFPVEGWRWFFATLPNAATFDPSSITILPRDHLICVITGATPGLPIHANGEVEVIPDMGRGIARQTY